MCLFCSAWVLFLYAAYLSVCVCACFDSLVQRFGRLLCSRIKTVLLCVAGMAPRFSARLRLMSPSVGWVGSGSTCDSSRGGNKSTYFMLQRRKVLVASLWPLLRVRGLLDSPRSELRSSSSSQTLFSGGKFLMSNWIVLMQGPLWLCLCV